jgi:hypothetical protein
MATHEETLKALENQAAILQKQKEIAQAQKDIAVAQKESAEAQKAAIEATFPKGETKPLAGEITTDANKFGYIAELVAYRAMKESAECVGREIDKSPLSPDPAKILIVGERGFAKGDLPLLQLDKQFKLFRAMLGEQLRKNDALLEQSEVALPEAPSIIELEGLPPEGPSVSELEAFPAAAITPALMLIPAVASSVADIVGYFPVNYDIKGQDFELGSDAIIAIVAGEIRKHHVYILNFNMIDDSDIVDRFINLITEKQKLAETKERLESQVVGPTASEIDTTTGEIAKLEAELKELKEDEGEEKRKHLENQIKESKDLLESKKELLDGANAAVAESESLGKALGDFLTSVTSTPDDKTPSLLAQAALRNHIRKQGITHILHLKILSSGGEAITKKRLWSSGETAYIGGSAISYILVTSEGRVVSSDTEVALAQLGHKLSAPGAAELWRIRFMDREV